MRIVALGTAFCWLGSLLVFAPFIGLFFLPVALVGGMIVWFSKINLQSKLVRGVLPLIPLIIYFVWLFSR